MKRKLNHTPSWALVHRHYQAALAAIKVSAPDRSRAGYGGESEYLSAKHAFLRRVSVEFHRRLKRAGIFVEGAA